MPVAQLVEQRTENPRVGGSIPPQGTIPFLMQCGSGSVVEHRLAKARVASSNLVSRFLFRERVKKKRQTLNCSNLCGQYKKRSYEDNI